MSTYAQVWGPFDCNRTPLVSLGTRLLIHKKPLSRESWSLHAVPSWYISPVVSQYCCFRTRVTETNAEKIANTVVCYPQGYYMPQVTSLDTDAAAAYDIVQACLRPRPPTLSPLCLESIHDSLLRLVTIFKDSILRENQSSTNSTPVSTDLDSILSPFPITHPTTLLPTSHLLFSLFPRVDSPTTIFASSALPRVVPTQELTPVILPPILSPTIAPPTHSHVTRNPGWRRR